MSIFISQMKNLSTITLQLLSRTGFHPGYCCYPKSEFFPKYHVVSGKESGIYYLQVSPSDLNMPFSYVLVHLAFEMETWAV